MESRNAEHASKFKALHLGVTPTAGDIKGGTSMGIKVYKGYTVLLKHLS